MSRVNRIDHVDGALKPPQRMDNGFLKVEGRIARVGIQEYMDSAGRIRRELRIPEEVFNADSLASFHQVPVTNGHPSVMLTAKNTKQFAVGSVGENVRKDGDYVAAPLMITDDAAIAAIEQGRSQLSNGYSCELDETQFPDLIAKWGRYDSIQRNIRGNHCALVDVARAGPGASIRLDEGDAVACDSTGLLGFKPDTSEVKRMPLKMKLDGFEIEVADANSQAIIERALDTQKTRADEAEKRATKEQARADVAEARVKDLEAEVAKLPAIARELANTRAALISKVVEVAGSNAKTDGTDLELMKTVIGKVMPDIKLDGKDEAYVRPVYDAAVVQHAKAPKAIDIARGGVGGAIHRDDAMRTPEQAREEMLARNRAAFVK